jgi:H+/Cl- antiporter ClcA
MKKFDLQRKGPLHHSLVIVLLTSLVVGLCGGIVGQVLVKIINLFTNIFFYQTISFSPTSPADNHLGWWVIAVPVVGGVIVGLMAKFGHEAIRGHGIPEAMETVLYKESLIPRRLTLLKPISAAFSIGSGGPFGAEGPIIATGSAIGSWIGRIKYFNKYDRKILLAAGAAAGMTSIFGSPVSAILLAIELLLFEYRPKSFLPVALSALTAYGYRSMTFGLAPAFHMGTLSEVATQSLPLYLIEGVILGFAAIFITKIIYWVEDMFDESPVHWMWWPAIGGLVVGIVGYISPKTMGVGYVNIEAIINGEWVGPSLFFFIFMKWLSWSISLGSGTSGGTLAPLFTLGGGLGSLFGTTMQKYLPSMQVDIKMAALVGMAAVFTGSTRAFFTSMVFAFEVTHQMSSWGPLLAGCLGAFLTSGLFMENTIMTEKIARRGKPIPFEYGPITEQ